MMSKPVKSSKRALRRHHAERIYERAVHKYESWGLGEEKALWLRRLCNNPTVCSCWMCGHQRKWHGVTMQERRSLMALADEN